MRAGPEPAVPLWQLDELTDIVYNEADTLRYAAFIASNYAAARRWNVQLNKGGEKSIYIAVAGRWHVLALSGSNWCP